MNGNDFPLSQKSQAETKCIKHFKDMNPFSKCEHRCNTFKKKNVTKNFLEEKEMTALNVKLFFLTSLIYFGTGNCILSKVNSNSAVENSDIKKTDNMASQSIDRDYISGFEDNYSHGSYGLSGHANYGFPESHDGYGVTEGSKHHIHHGEDHHHHHHEHHKHYDYSHHKALAIKSLLVPLAGVALLGAAAAFVSNPILLQLGVISGSSLGRRKRDTNTNLNLLKASISQEDRIRLNEIKLLEKFMTQIPERERETQEKKVFANYLSCSGITMQNLCLERLACELHSSEGTSMPMETNILTIVVNEILDNKFIPNETKIRLTKAVERGTNDFGCGVYECEELGKQENKILYGN